MDQCVLGEKNSKAKRETEEQKTMFFCREKKAEGWAEAAFGVPKPNVGQTESEKERLDDNQPKGGRGG